ncbi:hypothetical protein BDW22DRAFT_1361665 [Trametopsis cervina]|nr:hypothetical protein BDW22DRAFT_1361665 [Trametopsis cervina]
MVPLPPELLHSIFEFVDEYAYYVPNYHRDPSHNLLGLASIRTRGRTRDLQMCRLVSKQWEQLFLPRLFFRLVIETADDYERFMDLFAGRTTVPLMTLHIKVFRFYTWISSTGATPGDEPLDILARLPALRSVSLHFKTESEDEQVAQASHRTVSAPAGTTAIEPARMRLTLDKLSINHTFLDPPNLLKIALVLKRFSSIDTLALNRVQIRETTIQQPNDGAVNATSEATTLIGELDLGSTYVSVAQHLYVALPHLRHPSRLKVELYPDTPGLLATADFLSSFDPLAPLLSLTIQTTFSRSSCQTQRKSQVLTRAPSRSCVLSERASLADILCNS